MRVSVAGCAATVSAMIISVFCDGGMMASSVFYCAAADVFLFRRTHPNAVNIWV